MPAQNPSANAAMLGMPYPATTFHAAVHPTLTSPIPSRPSLSRSSCCLNARPTCSQLRLTYPFHASACTKMNKRMTTINTSLPKLYDMGVERRAGVEIGKMCNGYQRQGIPRGRLLRHSQTENTRQYETAAHRLRLRVRPTSPLCVQQGGWSNHQLHNIIIGIPTSLFSL